jgi:lauroyl/myristoyl acyltransferase
MDMQAFFTSEKGTRLGMWVGKTMPRRVGYALVKLAIPWIARNRNTAINRHIRSNQSVARGLPIDSLELDQAVREVLTNAGNGYYELYHRLGQGHQAVKDAVTFSPRLTEYLDQAREKGIGTVIVSPHIGNFDLGLYAFAAAGYSIQVITYAMPPGGYEIQNRMRANAGYIITPASGESVKQALHRLKAGGVVATGIDRPIVDVPEDKWIQFFGRPAPLPTGYIRLALSTNSQLLLIHVEPDRDNTYYVGVLPPIELEITGNRTRDAVSNTELVLSHAKEIIRSRPDEWMMFHPVWPQILKEF